MKTINHFKLFSLQPKLNAVSLVNNKIYPYLRISYFQVLGKKKNQSQPQTNKKRTITKQNQQEKKKKKGEGRKYQKKLNINLLKDPFLIQVVNW